MSEKIIGIMGAMPEEISSIADLISDKREVEIGGRKYNTGSINGIKTVLAFSRMGKVAAAITVTSLIMEFGITDLLFTGVAGAIHPDLKIGDIVVGKQLFQHDMDASPIFQQFEIPLLNRTYFETEEKRINAAKKIIQELFRRKHLERLISREELAHFNIFNPTVYIGDIASGDQFFSGKKEKQTLSEKLPSVLCVEMEGAAVAQVCYEYNIPFTVIRTISDAADENAEMDFPAFIKNIANRYSQEIVKLWMRRKL